MLLKPRPVWILPNNDEAISPFDIGSPLAEKGNLYEAYALISPITPGLFGGAGTPARGLMKNILVKRKDLFIKPAVDNYTTLITGASTDASRTVERVRNLTRNSFIFIKKPTLTVVPAASATTEDGDIPGAGFQITMTNPTDDSWYGDWNLKIYLSTDEDIYWDDYGEDGPPHLASFNWSDIAGAGDILEGTKFTVQLSTYITGSYQEITVGDFYFGQGTNIIVDFDHSTTPADWTAVVTYDEVDSKTSFTTTNCPAWIFSSNCAFGPNGTIGHIEYDVALAALETDGYVDYAPWELQ